MKTNTAFVAMGGAGVVVLGLFIVLQGQLTEQREDIDALHKELSEAQAVVAEVIVLRADVNAQRRRIHTLESMGPRGVARGARGSEDAERADNAPRRRPLSRDAVESDETLDIIAAEVAHRLVESPVLQGDGPADPEAVRQIVADVARQEREERDTRRADRRRERTQERVQRYTQTLGLTTTQSAEVEHTLNMGETRARDVRSRLREGELGWTQARAEWSSIRATTDTQLEHALGAEKAAELMELRAEDEPRGRRERTRP